MKQEKEHLRKSIVLTLVLYGAVAVLLGVSLHFRTPSVTVATSQPVSIVKAVTVNQSQVQEEMHKIQEQRQEQQRKEQAHQQYLKHLAQQARQQRVREQKQMAILKTQQMKLAKQEKMEAIRAHQKLMDLQKQQKAEQQKLAAMHARAEQQKQAALKKQADEAKAKVLAQKKQQLAAEKALEQQINGEQSRLNAARNQELMSEMAKYKALILNAIGQQWIMPKNTDKNLSTELSIRLAPGGTVLDVSLLRSSGNAVLDRSVITAVRKASPLPVPRDPTVFNQFRELHLVVRPEGLLG
ncbi:MAG: cell envelope integrity protein TolA [Gammaproteobacteria bacterium]|nr:cell envelope integrity protein TolA [Gammaproteobacteria bacterium]MBU1558416.1 cell envelope integrity protein TolA [Gammaproteobacteria bacterium]MBU1628500.1 cell envelope integrity protein TolA [Gammaproteobacteria bacterium]MBU1927207.1 cell envelope integrity protein TolA [Gammaproteobacteria bacterium]MBU2545667.1 cell envelope integrity protein TolA [Gammaproteobacteria bacterium]